MRKRYIDKNRCISETWNTRVTTKYYCERKIDQRQKNGTEHTHTHELKVCNTQIRCIIPRMRESIDKKRLLLNVGVSRWQSAPADRQNVHIYWMVGLFNMNIKICKMHYSSSINNNNEQKLGACHQHKWQSSKSDIPLPRLFIYSSLRMSYSAPENANYL